MTNFKWKWIYVIIKKIFHTFVVEIIQDIFRILNLSAVDGASAIDSFIWAIYDILCKEMIINIPKKLCPLF